MTGGAIEPFTLTTDDGADLSAWRLLPGDRPKAIVQIAHGMAEHSARYHRLARALSAAGYGVYAADHRGHGGSAGVHGLGSFGPGGFPRVAEDMAALSARIEAQHPGPPLVLLGHSMGSFAAQLYLPAHHRRLAALVLSGTAAIEAMLAQIAASGAPPGPGFMNAAFQPARTDFDWLSSDEAEVDAYVADPLCGFPLAEESVASVFQSAAAAPRDPRLADVRSDLPVLVISGADDPVTGPGQASAQVLIDSWRAAGLSRIEHRVWPGRHELFNEINRDAVTSDLIAWLDRTIG